MAEMLFCFAGECDARALCDMYMEKTKWFAARGIEQWDAEYISKNYSEGRIAGYARSGSFVVLRAGGEILAGHALLQSCDKWPFSEPNCMYIDCLVSRAPGAGKALLAKTIEHCRARGVAKLKLDCQDHNERLKRYYADIGFEEVGKARHKVFADRRSCLMELGLTIDAADWRKGGPAWTNE